jgi:hypothetical protein
MSLELLPLCQRHVPWMILTVKHVSNKITEK